MSFESLLIHSVTVYNVTEGPATNRYGDPEDVWDAGTACAARVEPVVPREELLQNRDTRLTVFRVFLLPGTAISATSKIAWGGHEHRVVGEPALYYDGTGAHHYELLMERIEG